MWPKAFAQLIELAPHISRLVPLADRFLQSKTGPEDTGRQTAEAFSARLQAGLEAELGRIAAAQGGLAKQIGSLSESVAAVGSDTRATGTALKSLQASFAAAETQGAALKTQLTSMESRLSAIDVHMQRTSERVRLGPVVLLLVLTNLILLAAAMALLVRGR